MPLHEVRFRSVASHRHRHGLEVRAIHLRGPADRLVFRVVDDNAAAVQVNVFEEVNCDERWGGLEHSVRGGIRADVGSMCGGGSRAERECQYRRETECSHCRYLCRYLSACPSSRRASWALAHSRSSMIITVD